MERDPEPAIAEWSVIGDSTPYISAREMKEAFKGFSRFLTKANLDAVDEDHEASEVKEQNVEEYLPKEPKEQIKNVTYSWDNRPFLKVVTHLSYMLLLPYFTIGMLRTLFITISASEQFGKAYKTFAVLSAFRFLPVILFGLFCQRVGIVIGMFVLNLFGMCGFVLLLFSSRIAMYISVTCAVMFTASNLTVTYSYISEVQPKKHFGKLAGIASLVAGLLQLLSHPIYVWSSDTLGNNFLPANSIMIALSFLSIPICVYLWILLERRRKTEIGGSPSKAKVSPKPKSDEYVGKPLDNLRRRSSVCVCV